MSSKPYVWEDMHIEDFQALPAKLVKGVITADMVAQLHALGQTCEKAAQAGEARAAARREEKKAREAEEEQERQKNQCSQSEEAKAAAIQAAMQTTRAEKDDFTVHNKRHGTALHNKFYLQAHSFVFEHAPLLVARMRKIMEEVDAKEWRLLEGETVKVRLLEYHTYLAGGGLTGKDFEKHFDGGSLLTMVMMISQGGDSNPAAEYTGGRLRVGVNDWVTGEREEYVDGGLENIGDCVIFPSHKYHEVSPVLSGKRHVAVMELWNEHQGYEDWRPTRSLNQDRVA